MKAGIRRMKEGMKEGHRRGPLVVVDYKTGRRPLTTGDARASMPLALYALAAARVLRRPCRRVELHHLPTGEIHAWEHSDATLAGTSAGPRISPLSARTPMSSSRPPRPGLPRGRRAGRRRPSRPGPAPDAAGAISAVAAPRAARRRRPAVPGMGSDPPTESRPGDGLAAPSRSAPPALGGQRLRHSGGQRLRHWAVRSAGQRLRHSIEFQNWVSVLAVVSGASTAGEWAAPGMQTRLAFSRNAMSSWIAGSHASSSSP